MEYYYQHNDFWDLYIPNPIGGVNWGTDTYAIEFCIMVGSAPSRISTPVMLGSKDVVKAGSGIRFESTGSLSITARNTNTNVTSTVFQSPRGFLIEDWNFHTYRVEHFNNGVYNFIRDGVLFATGKFTSDWYSSLDAGFDYIFRTFASTTSANNFKYIKTEGFEVNEDWNSTLFTGTNTVIPSASGTNDVIYRQASNNVPADIPVANWRVIQQSAGEYYLDLPTNGAYLTHPNIVLNYLNNFSVKFRLLINPEDTTGIITLWSNSTNNSASMYCDTSTGIFYLKRTTATTLFNTDTGFILNDGVPHTYEILRVGSSLLFIRDMQVITTTTLSTGNVSDIYNTMLKSNQGFSQAKTRLFFLEINGSGVTNTTMNQWNAAYSVASNQLKTVRTTNAANQIGTWPSDGSQWIEYIPTPVVGTRFYLNKPSDTWATSGYLLFRDEIRGSVGDKPFTIEFSIAISPTDTGKITLLSSIAAGKSELTLNNLDSDTLNNIVLKFGMSNIGTITFATSDNGILLRDGDFHTYRFEHDYDNNCIFYRDGVQFGTPTTYLNSNGIVSGGGFSQLLRSADGSDNGNVRLEYLKIVGLDHADEWNAVYAKQSGAVLPAKQSKQPPYQVLDWPSDNSEWLSVGGAITLVLNRRTINVQSTPISYSIGIHTQLNKSSLGSTELMLDGLFGGALVIPRTPLNLRGKELEKLQTLPFIESIYAQHLVVEGSNVSPKSVVDLSKDSLTISSLTQTITVSAGISVYSNILSESLGIIGKPPTLLCGNDLVLQAGEFTPLTKNVELSLRYGVIPIEQIFNLTTKAKFLELHVPKQFFELTDK